MGAKILYLLIAGIFLVSIGYGQVILVSDNVADYALAKIVEKKLGYEVVKTPWGKYEEEVLNKIINLNPSVVVIIGGPVAVPELYEKKLLELNITVKRIYGENRIETAIKVAKFLNLTNVVIVNGYDPLSIRKALDLAMREDCMLIFIKQEIPSEVRKMLEVAKRKLLIKTPGVNITEEEVEIIEEDLYNKTLNLIEYVKERISEIKERLKNETNKGIYIAVDRVLKNAEKVLNESIERLEDKKLQAAYNLAISAMYMVEAAERILERAQLEKFGEIFREELKELRKELMEMKKELKSLKMRYIKELNKTLEMCLEQNISREKCNEMIEELREEFRDEIEEIVEEMKEMKYEFMEELKEMAEEYREKMFEMRKEMREKMHEMREEMREIMRGLRED